MFYKEWWRVTVKSPDIHYDQIYYFKAANCMGKNSFFLFKSWFVMYSSISSPPSYFKNNCFSLFDKLSTSIFASTCICLQGRTTPPPSSFGSGHGRNIGTFSHFSFYFPAIIQNVTKMWRKTLWYISDG